MKRRFADAFTAVKFVNAQHLYYRPYPKQFFRYSLLCFPFEDNNSTKIPPARS